MDLRPWKDRTLSITESRAGFAVGTLVRARGREWVVLPDTTPDFLLLQPLGGGPEEPGRLPEQPTRDNVEARNG